MQHVRLEAARAYATDALDAVDAAKWRHGRERLADLTTDSGSADVIRYASMTS